MESVIKVIRSQTWYGCPRLIIRFVICFIAAGLYSTCSVRLHFDAYAPEMEHLHSEHGIILYYSPTIFFMITHLQMSSDEISNKRDKVSQNKINLELELSMAGGDAIYRRPPREYGPHTYHSSDLFIRKSNTTL